MPLVKDILDPDFRQFLHNAELRERSEPRDGGAGRGAHGGSKRLVHLYENRVK